LNVTILEKISGCIIWKLNLIDSKSISVKKRMNKNFCRNYQIRIINSFLLNVSEFLDDRPSIGNVARYRVLFAYNQKFRRSQKILTKSL